MELLYEQKNKPNEIEIKLVQFCAWNACQQKDEAAKKFSNSFKKRLKFCENLAKILKHKKVIKSS